MRKSASAPIRLFARFGTIALLSAGLLGTPACYSWTSQPYQRIAPQQKHLRVWRGGELLQLVDAVISPDSITGRSPSDKALRIAIPRAEIDSIRVRTGDAVKAIIVGTFAAPIAFIVFWCANGFCGGHFD